MKNGDKITVTKPGIFNGCEGTILSTAYSVDLGSLGVWNFKEGEIIQQGKEAVVKPIKTAPKQESSIVEDISKILNESGIKTEVVKTKRPYNKGGKPKVIKQKRKYNRKPKDGN